jgi:thiol-disulfide isomerase/thioredoxin
VTNEFADIEERLARYRPATPSDEARRRTAALIQSRSSVMAGRWRPVAASVALLLLATAAWWMRDLWQDRDAAAAIPEAFVQGWASSPRETVPGFTTHAKVSIVFYTDWQCPPCLDLYPALTALVKSYNEAREGPVDLIVRDWPWSSTCNPHVPTDMHRVACELASAVRVSRKHGRETEMVDWIRSNRDRLTDPDAATRVKEELRRLLAGIDVETQDAAAAAELREDVSGTPVAIDATPTVFVNGVRLVSPHVTAIDWAIRLELSRTSR